MGVENQSIVNDDRELVRRVEYILNKYKQPALVEEFLPGREFTVGFIGNPGDPSNRRQPDIYDTDGYHWFPILEIDNFSSVSPQVYGMMPSLSILVYRGRQAIYALRISPLH